MQKCKIDTLKNLLASLVISLSFVASFNASAQEFQSNGSAEDLGNACFMLTPATSFQAGSVWSTSTINLNEPFSIAFYANFDNIAGGADGLTFAFQGLGPGALGINGGSLGINGIIPSFLVEFDIYQNGNFQDPPFDHIAVMRNGNNTHNNLDNLFGPVQAGAMASIKDGQDHIVEIHWNPEIQEFIVNFDCEERVAMTVDLIDVMFSGNPNVTWGFTGSTGGQVAEIVVCLQEPVESPEPVVFETCPGEAVNLAIEVNDEWTYQWSPAEFLNDPTLPNPTATVQETTVFTAQVFSYCDTFFEQQVTVETTNDLTLDLGADLNFCDGDSAVLSVPEGLDALWSNGETTSSIQVFSSGSYWAEVSFFGCTASDTVIVVVAAEIDSLIFSVQDATCGGNDGSIEILDVPGGTPPFVYSVNGQAQSDSFFNELMGGEYVIQVSDAQGCSISEVAEVQVLFITSAGFEASPLSGVAPLEVGIENTSQNADNFLYLFGDETVFGDVDLITISEQGSYELMQIAWLFDIACADTAIVTIEVAAEVRLDIPNIVTPNGDGANDFFVIQTIGITSYDIEIFNRWGKQLFRSNTITIEDGMHMVWDPQEYSDGNYVYVMRFSDSNAQNGIREGNLTVVR